MSTQNPRTGKEPPVTLRYPDISAYQAGISLAGAVAVCIKVTEGADWANSDYLAALARAADAGAWAFAYHFLHAGATARQAAWCRQHDAGRPLMIDAEPTTGSRPGLGDITAFTDAYRAGGGRAGLVYLPRWYWEQIGSPNLAPLAGRGLTLVASNYTAYSDTSSGAGWQPYGGMTPAIWQYTDRQPFGGMLVDFNAFRGDLPGLQAAAAATAGPPPPAWTADPPAWPYPPGDWLGLPSPNPRCHSGYWGGPDAAAVHTWQAQMGRRGWQLAADGRYGPATATVCRLFQAEKGLPVDGLAGPATWAAAWTAPPA
jgi:GH25 family lysozyme M1 (1,4-beta-N-acetylmuramidase)